jgi:pimeloyl-ACP methyl ester carboxylesterase
VIHGSNDMVVPLAAGKHLHQSLKNAELVTISETSHQVFEEKAGEVAKEIIEFISRFMN